MARKPRSQAHVESSAAATRLEQCLGGLAAILKPEDAPEPIFGASIRGTIYEWLAEINAADELKAVGIKPRSTALLYGPPGTGKEQPLTAKILTPNGWMTMGEMRVGTVISGADGRTHRVVGVYPQGVKPAFRITFRDGTEAEAGADHLWKVRGRHGARDGWVIRTTRQLMDGNAKKRVSRNFRIPLPQPVEFVPSGDIPVAPYVMGVLIGDGALTLNSVAISVPPAKEPIRAKVASLLGDEYEMRVYNEGASAPQWRIVGGKRNSTSMKSIMNSLGLCVRSADRAIPNVYKFASVNDRIELLRGLMDTDGAARDGRTTFSTQSHKLAEDVCDLVRSLGGVAISHRYSRKESVEFQINIRMAECPFHLGYKAAGWRPANVCFGKHIKSIEYIGDVEQQCIMVDAPDHLYITDGFNVTHNTTLAYHLAARLNLPMVSVGAENLISMWLGESGANVARLFDGVKKADTKCIVFVDEFDAIGSKRTAETGGASQERNATISVLLRKIEQFDGMFIAATNLKDNIDPALWRRFGMQIEVALPDSESRWAIIKSYLSPFEWDDDAITDLSVYLEGAPPSLIRQLMEGVKRRLVIAPRIRQSIKTAPEVFAPVVHSVSVHPEIVSPPLWSDTKRCLEVLKEHKWPPELPKQIDKEPGE